MGSKDESTAKTGHEAPGQSAQYGLHWVSRKLHPIILLYVLLVFAALVAVSHFVFHSSEAVKALIMAAIVFMGSLVPPILAKIEYRQTDTGIEKGPFKADRSGPYTDVFSWDELSHVVSVRNGFKYFKNLDDASTFRRFWRTHFSDKFSGEIHVDAPDQARVKALLLEREITIRE